MMLFCCKSKKEDVISLTSQSQNRPKEEITGSPLKPGHKSLLSQSAAMSILKEIPIVLQCDLWECVYNLVDHGSDITSFYTLTNGLTHTLIIIETIDGYKFGGFASGAWKREKEYFGNGTSFVFSIDRNDKVEIYKWTQRNDYILWATNREIGMGGGGGGFAFTLYDDMAHGQSSATETFNNPSLYLPDDSGDERSEVNDPVELILNVLTPVKEESEHSISMIESIRREPPPTESLRADLISSELPHADNMRSYRTDSIRSLKSQSPFKVSQVQVYGFSSELRNRKKMPKGIQKSWGNRASETRPSR